MLDISPEVNWLHSARARNIGWEKALAELIDNAFDARANQVRITSVARTIVVSDDGSGVRDLSATVRSGRHVPTDSTELGMFGVGLKDAWHWAGHRMEVDTVHAGVRGVLIADSREMLKSSRWEIDDPVYTECHGAPTGTSITLHLANTAPRRNAPSEQVYKNLAWIFTPALLDGKQITVPAGRKSKPLKSIALPDLIDVIDDAFTVSGKSVSLRAGIIADGQRMVRGPFWIQYGHRNIAHKPIGCGSYSAERIGGIIKLAKGDWDLSVNKDDLTDYKEELADEIFARIEWMLKKADHLSEELANDELQAELESELNQAFVTAKKTERECRPGSAGLSGAINAIGSSRNRRRAANSDPDLSGSVESLAEAKEGTARKKRGIHLAFRDLENGTLGEYDDFSNRVTLNRSHPFVQYARQSKEYKPTLHALATSLICHWAVTNSGKQKLLFEAADFAETFGRVLESINRSSVQDVKAAV